MNRFLLITTLCFFIFSVSGPVLAAAVWTPQGKIGVLDEYGAGLKVKGLDFSSNPASCEPAGSELWAVPNSSLTAEAQNRMNSMLLAALMAGKNVRLKLSGSQCDAGQPVYFAVRVLSD